MAVSRPSAGEPRPALGRARRFACTHEGAPAELFVLPPGDARVALRLATFGAAGIGGVVAWGEDEDGVWLVRQVPARTLERLAERLAPDEALAAVLDLARALAACEAQSLFPGAMRPEEVALGPGGAWLVADALVRAMLGDAAAHGATKSAPSPRWTPPAQADGAPFDNAANRYVLGLVAYRLVSGALPLAGLGLRDAANAARIAPPPFDEALARTLRPGFQSLVLAMLAPATAERPASASAIVARLEALRSGARPAVAAVVAPPPTPVAVRVERARAPSSRDRRLALVPVAFGAAVLVLGLASARSAEHATSAKPAASAPRVTAERAPLASTTAATCASCHPRQVAEWQRSVMAHASRSPLFGALESAIEEQAGRSSACPNGAGVLRRAGGDVCRDETTGRPVTGSGGEHWCVNCHAAADNLGSRVPAWAATSGDARARRPLADLLGPAALEGISCGVCHQTIGPVHGARGGGDYEGNATWTSPATGAVFAMRPEDARGQPGIGNSGYVLDPASFLRTTLGDGRSASDPVVHARASAEARAYLGTSEACGACHDVRLFGTDALGVRERGEHFKRLRNAYSEWRAWADGERAAGRRAASCQDCHMSLYPGVCVPGPAAAREASECPPGFHFEARAPGEKARDLVATTSTSPVVVTSHWFTSVDVPLARDYPSAWADDAELDASGVPMGLEKRRAELLRHTFRFEVTPPSLRGDRLEVPLEIENVGAGHRVPAGFSQEREVWVELSVRDARGRVLYEVGRVDRDDADLRDKIMTRVATRASETDARGRPLGVFGADVIDGPDVPRWRPVEAPTGGGVALRGRGLVNLQNGFFRCVRCIGVVDAEGRCQAGDGQGRHRADRFADAPYDPDTGSCTSNLTGEHALFETYFPIGSLDAERGVLKAPDAILDTRSAPPHVPLRYTYELDVPGAALPLHVHARLRFRAFPPFLLRAFAAYEAEQAALGLRPSGAQLTTASAARNRIVELAEVDVEVGRRTP